EVAGNWGGRQGYTSGLLPPGTPPEKDVGYPYAASWGDASADVVAAMAGYSWQRHLIRHGVYGDWVDRGRMTPAHRQWSGYLREVAEVAGAEMVRGIVTGLEVAGGDRWKVRHRQRLRRLPIQRRSSYRDALIAEHEPTHAREPYTWVPPRGCANPPEPIWTSPSPGC